MRVSASLWESSAAFCCCVVSGFADLTAQNNKPDGSSDFRGQEQRVKVNSRGREAWQGRERTHGMTLEHRLQAEWEEEVPELAARGGNRPGNRDGKVWEHNKEQGNQTKKSLLVLSSVKHL